MNDRIRSHIELKLDAASIERGPFPHLIIEEFFPPDVYAKILKFNPFFMNRGREWLSRDASPNGSRRVPYHARKQINFHKDDSFLAPPEQQQFWEELNACFLGDGWFGRLIIKKYPEYFHTRFGDVINEPGFEASFCKDLFLQRHDAGYFLRPHTDVSTRVFTCIFSFADANGFEKFGTELLLPKDPMMRCRGEDHYEPECFTVAKVAPYKPNNFLLFFKTRQSFHAVATITDNVPNQRYGMQFQFYEPPNGILQDLARPGLTATRHLPGRTEKAMSATASMVPGL